MGVGVVREELRDRVLGVGLEDREAGDREVLLAVRPDGGHRRQRGAQVDEGVTGLAGPLHPRLHAGLGLLRRGVRHLRLGVGRGSVEHQILRHEFPIPRAAGSSRKLRCRGAWLLRTPRILYALW